MNSKLIKIMKNPKLVIIYMLKIKFIKKLPDSIFLKIKYRLIMERKLNLKNPEKFNEKIQWLKLYDRKPEYTHMVDKYEVREYIKDKMGEKYLIPLLGVYNNYNEIDFNVLPDQFVLKPNHTSGNVFICKDKSKINHSELEKEVNMWLEREYFWVHREWPYKNVKPKIICEKYMVEELGKDLKDYKIMCFNGEVKCSFVCLNRNSSTGLNIDFYDRDWVPMPFERHYPKSGTITKKPKNYYLMIELAEKVSKGIPFVRVDFYEINGELYFGELTFYPGSGFEKFSPQSYDEVLGEWIKI